jgi:hypothetical protein
MAKKGKSKRFKKQTSGLVKILEAVVIIGSMAAVLIKFFKGKKNKK